MRVMLVGVALVALSVATPVARPRPARIRSQATTATAPPLPTIKSKRSFMTRKWSRPRASARVSPGTIRATLTDGTLTHDAQIQQIEEKKTQFEAAGRLGVQLSRTAGGSTSRPTGSIG